MAPSLYREVNKVTKKDSYPLQAVDLILQNLEGKKFLSTLDLASGYCQVPSTDQANEISVSVRTSGIFKFRVLLRGLTTAPAVFQRLMEIVLGKLIGAEVAVYIDDILISTETELRHYEVLSQVFEEFRKAHLNLKPQKCRLMESTIDCLGHIVGAQGAHMNPDKVKRIVEYPRPQSVSPDKVKRIVEYPRPQSVSQLRAFLGLAGYYRKFVLRLRFARTAKPLHDLTSARRAFVRGATQEQAFESLKKVFSEAPVLPQQGIEKARNNQRLFCIYTDASSWLEELRCDKDFNMMIEAVEANRQVEVRFPRYDKILSSTDSVIEDGR
ncbi:hypothetical protein COOONC_01002 [Cooperia oncophora]